MKKLQFVSLLLCLALALGGCGDVTIGESQSNAGQSAQAGEQTVGQSQGEEQVLSTSASPPSFPARASLCSTGRSGTGKACPPST